MSHDGDSARSTANPKHSPSQVKEVNSHRGQTPWTATHVIATRGTTRDNAAPDDPRQLRCAGARPSPTAVAQIDGERAQRAQRAQGAASPRRLAAQAQRTTAPRLCTALTCHAVLALMQREQEAVLVRIPEAHLLRHHANHILGRARARAAVRHADGAPPTSCASSCATATRAPQRHRTCTVVVASTSSVFMLLSRRCTSHTTFPLIMRRPEVS
jgi:hypothetical protein